MSQEIFPGHPRLETSRFILCPIRTEEIEFHGELVHWVGKPATTPEQIRDSVQKNAEEYAAGRCLHWLAEAKHDGTVVGAIGYYRGFENSRSPTERIFPRSRSSRTSDSGYEHEAANGDRRFLLARAYPESRHK